MTRDTCHLAAGLPEPPGPGPDRGDALLLPGEGVGPLQPAVVGVELEVGGAEAELLYPPPGPAM